MAVAVRTAHSAGPGAALFGAARALLDEAFGGDVDDDGEHSLGGVPALAGEDGEVVGRASVVQRRLLHGGRALRTGYLEGVAVRADHRGRGMGAALVDPLERVVRGAHELGALAWTEEVLGLVLPSPGLALDLDGDLTCDWRDGDAW